MRISEAIASLSQLKEEHGDLELVSLSDADGGFMIEFGRVFEMIELPDNDDPNAKNWTSVIAFLEPSESAGAPHLTLIQ